MITSLSLTDLGVIESAELELGEGLNVLTGETGAGKTMVVTSLQLLLGARGSADLVRTGSERAQVSVELSGDAPDTVLERVEQAGGVVDDGVITMARVLSAAGRSRAALGGASVPIAVLGEVGPELVAIHGQNDQSKLMSPAQQRDLLDRFAGLGGLASEVAAHFEQFRSLQAEHDELANRRQERLREADSLTFGLNEVSAVSPVAGEDEALLAEESRLAHAVELKIAAESVAAAISDDEAGLADQVGQLQRTLDAVSEHDQQVSGIAARLADVGYAVSDIASELHAYSDGIEADPARLGEVQERRAALTGMMRKYGPTLNDVLSWAADAEERLSTLSVTDDRLAELETAIEKAAADWASAALDLSDRRTQAAATLGEQVTGELSFLAMPDAQVLIEVTQRVTNGGERDHADAATLEVSLPTGGRAAASASGLDDVTFLLRPHTGAPLSPVQRGASGGELSRVMLAIEVVLAGADPVPTVVFDEVDAGVGGAAAVEVGRRLAQLGRTRQVLVVTHLPQVAAFADRHWVVEKATTGEVTASGVRELDEAARVKELTRMLAGLSDSSSGQAHAEELLEVARRTR
ncbi:MAG TPA: DNA repair protein RecN [Actinomycetes bacterium]|nr:DNA repair protein RecN [Actinomycetes bacterium]